MIIDLYVLVEPIERLADTLVTVVVDTKWTLSIALYINIQADFPDVTNSVCTTEVGPEDTIECVVDVSTKRQTSFHYVLEALAYNNDSSSVR